MKENIILRACALATALLCAGGAQGLNWDNALIMGTTPGGKMFYGPGEEMAFTLKLEGMKEPLPADTYFVDWERRGDDGLVERGRAPLPFPPEGLVLRTKSDKPGFVCIEANVVTKDGKRVPKNHRWEKRVFFQGGAGVQPEKIPMADEPADYDAFWAACMKELDAVPMDAQMTPVECPDKEVRLYAVRIPCAGPWPVTGYLTIPVKASPTNRVPIYASYRGASQDEQLAPKSGSHDGISMLINPNGYELGRGPEYVKQFFKDVSEPGYGYGMGPKSNEKKETSYWKWCALRAIRYLQWIKTLPEWDGKELVLSGGSQGDWQCYHAAAHVPGVTRINANGSWGCDWTGQNQFKRLRSTYRPSCWYPDMAYFDPVFAAKRISCPVNISFSGLGDYCSTPASLTLVYRNLKGPKKITYVQGSTHGWRPAGTQRFTIDGGWDAATTPPKKPADAKLGERLLESKDIVYRLDASCKGTLELDAGGKVTCWKSTNGNEYAFRPAGDACPTTNALNGRLVVSFRPAGHAFLAGSAQVEQRTVFIVCRPRRVAMPFMGVWGAYGADSGLRTAQGSANWENVRGGPDFNSAGTLIVNGTERTGSVQFLPNDIQVLALRHPEDLKMWGATSKALFVPAVGGYMKGRCFDGDVAEVVAFRRVLGVDECRAVCAVLEEKWNPGTAESAFDPLDAVRAALARGERKIVVPKRLYKIRPKDRGFYLRLKGVSDTVIDFSGSELRGLVNTGFFHLEDCTNVTIRNVELDYRDLPFTQARIVSADKDGTQTLETIDGYPRPTAGNTGGWPFQVYDKDTLELKNAMRSGAGFRIAWLADGRYRVSGGGNRAGAVGDIAVWSMPSPNGAMEGDHISVRDVIHSRATVRCVFENITEYATPGGRAFEEHLTEANVYRNCRIVRRPPETDFAKRGLKRLRSGNHDAFMSRRAVVGPKILGCTAMYHCDDAVNISGMYGVVYEVKGNAVRLLEYTPTVFHAGDTAQAMSVGGKPLPKMKVKAVGAREAMTAEERAYMTTIGLWPGLDRLCRTAITVTFDDAAALARGDAVISDRAQGNGFEIRGCRFGHNRAFCIRMRASNGTIADNVFDRPEGCGIYLGPEYEWLEGGLSENVTITNNIFVGCKLAISGTAAHRKRLPREVYRNVSVHVPTDGTSVVPAARIDPIGYIRGELAAGRRSIAIPKARYWLTPAPGETCYLTLTNLTGVTIDCAGSEFVGTVKTTMFGLHACTNVTLRNVAVDYADLPFTQATIEKVDKDGNWDVRVIPGYPCPAAHTLAAGDIWPVQAYDAKTLELKNPMRFRDNIAITRTGVDTYRITGGQNRKGDVGDIAVWSLLEQGRAVRRGAVTAGACKGCTFENVTVYSTPHGCGYAEASAEANRYINCSLMRRPPETDLFPRALKRLRSGNHDAFNSRCSYVGPTLDRCTFQYHCDDCVNISGFYAFVTEQKGRTLRIAPYGGNLRIDPGDTCQLMTFGGACLPDVKIVSLQAAGATTAAERKMFESYNLWPGIAAGVQRAFTAELDADRVLPPGSVIISNRRMGNGFRIRNCTMGHNRARGLLIKASDGIIESNLIERVEGWGVQIAPEYEWMEGGCSKDMVVKGNVFRDNGGGVLVAGNNGARKPLPADSHRNVAITDNAISGSVNGIAVVGCTGLDVRGNKIALPNHPNAREMNLVNVADVKK